MFGRINPRRTCVSSGLEGQCEGTKHKQPIGSPKMTRRGQTVSREGKSRSQRSKEQLNVVNSPKRGLGFGKLSKRSPARNEEEKRPSKNRVNKGQESAKKEGN